MQEKLIPIRIKSLDEELFFGHDKHLITGTFETYEGGDSLYTYSFNSDPQPYLLLGKESLYHIMLPVLKEIEQDLSIWLTDKDESKRKLAEQIVLWKKTKE